MENRAHALAAGLFTLLLGIGVLLAAQWFSRDNYEKVQYTLVSNHSVSGLNVQAAVRLTVVGQSVAARLVAGVAPEQLAVDPGIVVNPMQLKRQVEGGTVMGVSMALLEELQFDDYSTSAEALQSLIGRHEIIQLLIEKDFVFLFAVESHFFPIHFHNFYCLTSTNWSNSNLNRL